MLDCVIYICVGKTYLEENPSLFRSVFNGFKVLAFLFCVFNFGVGLAIFNNVKSFVLSNQNRNMFK